MISQGTKKDVQRGSDSMTRLVVVLAMFLAGCGLPLPCMALGLVDDAKMRRDSAGIATSGGDPYLSEDHIQ